ncbi:MAG: PAS domain S-box protein, partial [Nitrospinaceae bacterium]
IDRVRAFDALQTSEERIRSIVNNSLEGIITFFRTGAIASFNPAAETIFGFKAQEIMEQNIHQVLPDLFDAGGKVKPDLISGPHSLLGQLTETTGRHADGHPFPVDLALSELQIPERRKNPRTEIGRRPTLYIGMVRDITERKQFEEALRNERDHTAQIIERTPALVVSMTLDGTTRSVNPAVERTTGYTPAQLIGKNWWRTLFPGHQYRQVEQLFQDMKEEPVRNRELVMTIRSGEQRVVAWSTIQRFDERGTLVENIGFGTDITVQKQVEKELIRAARKAEESNRLKSDFLSIISHELRTPLTVMIGSTPLLMDENDLPESKELVNIVRDIDTSGKHLLALIDDLLDFSKIEAGKMDLVKELFSIREFMDGLIPACQMIAQNKNLTIQTEVEIKVWADKVRLKQIIFNLLSNAIKFTDQGKIHVRVRPEAGNAVFEVEDTGCGIAEDDLEVIFEAFRQVDASTTREASGTGLGLAITRRLVKLHGGIITVSSHAGQGSQFRFTIPLKNTGDF